MFFTCNTYFLLLFFLCLIAKSDVIVKKKNGMIHRSLSELSRAKLVAGQLGIIELLTRSTEMIPNDEIREIQYDIAYKSTFWQIGRLHFKTCAVVFLYPVWSRLMHRDSYTSNRVSTSIIHVSKALIQFIWMNLCTWSMNHTSLKCLESYRNVSVIDGIREME